MEAIGTIGSRFRALALERAKVMRFGQDTKCGAFEEATEIMVVMLDEGGKLAAHWSGTMWEAKGMWVGLVSFHRPGEAPATTSKAGGREGIADWIGATWVEWHGQIQQN